MTMPRQKVSWILRMSFLLFHASSCLLPRILSSFSSFCIISCFSQYRSFFSNLVYSAYYLITPNLFFKLCSFSVYCFGQCCLLFCNFHLKSVVYGSVSLTLVVSFVFVGLNQCYVHFSVGSLSWIRSRTSNNQ